MSTAELYIAISGDDFDPDLITSLLNVSPTSSHRKGDSLKFNKNASFSQWCISTGRVESNNPDFYELSASLVNKLSNKVDDILALKNQYKLSVTLQAALKCDKNSCNPIIGFDKDTIRFLSTIGASIDVDIY
ncbi:MAG TPA: DUF4279 domain-containing protein [Cellvibrio sp.]|nr:DUF4279 domain-containing protein [Cellvibrio sp.]